MVGARTHGDDGVVRVTFIAKYPGRCDDCREAIAAGQQVEYKGLGEARTLVHVVCDSPGEDELTHLDRAAALPVCPTCWLVGPCECEDD